MQTQVAKLPSALGAAGFHLSPCVNLPPPPQHSREVESHWLVTCPALVPYRLDGGPKWRDICAV